MCIRDSARAGALVLGVAEDALGGYAAASRVGAGALAAAWLVFWCFFPRELDVVAAGSPPPEDAADDASDAAELCPAAHAASDAPPPAVERQKEAESSEAPSEFELAEADSKEEVAFV